MVSHDPANQLEMSEQTDLTEVSNCKLLQFRCSKKWEQLAPTEHNDIRFCGECKERVYFCQTQADIYSHFEQSHCIAFKNFDDDFLGMLPAQRGCVEIDPVRDGLAPNFLRSNVSDIELRALLREIELPRPSWSQIIFSLMSRLTFWLWFVAVGFVLFATWKIVFD